ncbi:MAG TPA: phytanoyl-CoA dioxygenase family protein, partial [Roseimicrobium sp.]|nr:phytanoyl-CoA dioxygenase family protein [Roseimicrobium sp.]
GSAGQRCLLDDAAVRQTALDLRRELIDSGVLPATAVAIQAITFDKNPATNWKVTWHQDLMFPFARKVESPDYTLPSIKDGIDYARPPREVMEDLLAVRLHLDDCDATNGPLRVASGSHRHGIFKCVEIPSMLQKSEEVACLAKEGEILLMRPLLLHASSPATAPKHRRVLHFVYHSGSPIAETWHRSI